MTNTTDRDNNQPKLWGVAEKVMVFFCLFIAGAYKSVHFRHTSGLDSVAYSTSGHASVVMLIIRSLMGSLGPVRFIVLFPRIRVRRTLPMAFLRNLTLYTLVRANSCRLAFLALVVRLRARFALILKSIFGCVSFVKCRYLLDDLAFGALLCYDGFGHVLFLHKRISSEPLQARYLCGSLYFNTNSYNVNKNQERTNDYARCTMDRWI